MSKEVHPPIAKIIPFEIEKHGNVRIDNYYWLNDRKKVPKADETRDVANAIVHYCIGSLRTGNVS